MYYRPDTTGMRLLCKKQRGFTLLEILLVVAAIAILAGIVIVAINPAQQLAETRNAQRRSDVNALSNALVQYVIKNSAVPSGMSAGESCYGDEYNEVAHGICRTGTGCAGVDLDSELVPDYIAAIPVDPSVPAGSDFSGYTVFLSPADRFLICAPLTEQTDDIISVTR